MTEVMLTGDEEVDVPWAEVARIIKSRNRIACQKKWDYLQVQQLCSRCSNKNTCHMRDMWTRGFLI